MRAFVFDKYKQPLHEADIPDPTVGERDVLVRVTAAGLNHLDERIRAGGFKAILPYKTPLTLGHDLSGTVISTGAKVRGFQAGDQVYARPRDFRIGTFAERIAVDESDLALPRHRSARWRQHRCRWWRSPHGKLSWKWAR